MNKKMNGTIWPRITAATVAILVVPGMLLSVTAARGDDGVAETPAITATATATAEITDDSVVEVPEVEDEGEKPETKKTKTPKPTSTATEESTEEPTQTPTSTSTATVEPTEEPTEEPTQTPTSTATATVEPTEDPTDPPIVLPDTPVSECTNGVWTITITYPADAYGDANGAVLWYDGQLQEESGNLDPGEWYTFEIREGLKSLRLDWHGWASQYPDVWWEFQRPSDCGPETEEPTEEPVPPMEQFVDVTIGKCEVTITQKANADWTEVIADNGNPSHWGISKGNPTLVVKPVDPTKDLVVRIITGSSVDESWEYYVRLEASASCGDPDPTPTPTPTDPPSGEPTGEPTPTDPPTTSTPTDPPTTSTPTDPPTTGEPTDPPTTGEPTDPPTTGEPTDPPTSTPTPDPTDPPTSTPTQTPKDPPSGKPTGEPTKAPTTAPSGDPGSGKSDPKGPAKTGAIGDDSTDTVLVGALAAILTSALVAMRMGRRSSGKYAARS